LCRYLVVTNPHIKRVYNAYYHAFETLRQYPTVKTLADNTAFCILLRRLVDEHGMLTVTSHSILTRHCNTVMSVCSALFEQQLQAQRVCCATS
jgi:[3-methyl-2-oxobutanoate dehydrogenase (acetyl-transferring)] kinase